MKRVTSIKLKDARSGRGQVVSPEQRKKRNPFIKQRRVLMKLYILLLLILVLPPGVHSAEEIDWTNIHDHTKKTLFSAQQAMNENRFQDVIEDLLAFQSKKPKFNHFLIEFNIGTAYGLSGNTNKAIEHLENAVVLEDVYPPLWLNLGKLYYQNKDFDKAGQALEKGFTISSAKSPDILFMAMAAYYQAENFKKSIELGNSLVFTFGKESFEIVSLLANSYIVSESYEDAVDTLNRLLIKNPSDPQVWKLLTQSYFKNQQLKEAAIAYEIYGYMDSLDREELIIMGDLFTMIGVPARAAQYYEEAMKDEAAADELDKLSVAYYSAYRFDDAIVAVNKALNKGTTSDRLLLKAQLYYLQDRFKEAEETYIAAAEHSTKDGHEWLMAGYCAMRNGEIKKARELLTKASQHPEQRNDAIAMIKMLAPVEELRELMASMKEVESYLNDEKQYSWEQVL